MRQRNGWTSRGLNRVPASVWASGFLAALLAVSGCEPEVSRDNPWDPSSDAYVDADGDQYPEVADCDDADAAVNPGVAELCNQKDDNCDGTSDEGLTLSNYYADDDDDGYGFGAATERCEGLPGEVTVNGDCNDRDEDIYPGAEEICDGEDQDCDGDVDDGLPEFTWYVDGDGDGYGAGLPEYGCDLPNDVVTTNGDCDDTDPAINPDAREICNGEDENCNGQIDDGISVGVFYVDGDGDGYGDPATEMTSCKRSNYVSNDLDCDDENDQINPAAQEVCDGVDNNCDSGGQIDEGFAVTTWYSDVDADGYGSSVEVARSCSQPDNSSARTGDCNDDDASVNPGASEVCDGQDNNCNSRIDEGLVFTTYYQDADADGHGTDAATLDDCVQPEGYVLSADDCNDADDSIHPDAQERFNATDDDCDGETDEHIPAASQSQGQLSISGSLPLYGMKVFSGKTDGTEPIVMGVLSDGSQYEGVAVWSNYSEGGQNAPHTVLGADQSGTPVAFTPFNLDDDAFLDYAVAVYDESTSATSLHLYLGSDVLAADATALAPTVFSIASLNASVDALASADTDGDGVDELIVGCASCTSVTGDAMGLILGIAPQYSVVTEPILTAVERFSIRDFDQNQVGRELAVTADGSLAVASDWNETLWAMSLQELSATDQALSDLVTVVLVPNLAPTEPGLSSLGTELMLVPDMNNDGEEELIYSAETMDQAGAVGVVYSPALLDGKYELETESIYFLGVVDSQHIGNVLTAAGDVDLDGISDFFIGSVIQNASAAVLTQSVESVLIRGGQYRSSTTLSAARIASFLSSDGTGLGIATAGTAQMNGAGGVDVIYAAPGFAENDVTGLIGVLNSPYESVASRRSNGAP